MLKMQNYMSARMYVFQFLLRTPGPTFCAGTQCANIPMKGKTSLDIVTLIRALIRESISIHSTNTVTLL